MDSWLNFTGMIEKSLHGYVEWAWDPYTEYFNIQENELFIGDLNGDRKFEGIGAVVSKKSEGIIIQEIIKWSPAFKAWLKTNDIVVMIEDKPTKSMSIFESISYIRGTGGTEVKLTIMRPSEQRLFEVKVMRAKINIPSVTSHIQNLSGLRIAHVTISILWEDTKASFAQIAHEITYPDPVDWIVLDVRGNGGGILDSAIDVASHFITRWSEVVTTNFKSMPTQSYLSKWYMTLEKIPVVVLIDEMSASAAEVLALALKHHRNAPLIGQKSFGKGTIQTMSFLPDGSSLKYTIGQRFGPKKFSINHTGIQPDYPISMDTTGFVYSGIDMQLDEANYYLTSLLTGVISDKWTWNIDSRQIR